MQAVIEIHDCAAPQPLPQLFAGHNFSGLFKQGDQESKGKILQAYAPALLRKVTGR
jgi:hypothetical protein